MAQDAPTRPDPTGEGSLTDIPLTEVLTSLAAARESGIVHLTGTYSSIVCLRDGQIYLAHADTGPSLRQVFLSSGVVDDIQWERSVEQTRDGLTLVDAILGSGDSVPERLRAALYEHTISTLFELLVPNSNRFRFGRGEVHQLGARFLFPVDEVLNAASARLRDFTVIARAFPSTDVVVRVVPRLPPDTPQVTVSAIEWQVLAAVDGQRTVADIIEQVGHSAFTVFSTLHRLLRAGAIEAVGRP